MKDAIFFDKKKRLFGFALSLLNQSTTQKAFNEEGFWDRKKEIPC